MHFPQNSFVRRLRPLLFIISKRNSPVQNAQLALAAKKQSSPSMQYFGNGLKPEILSLQTLVQRRSSDHAHIRPEDGIKVFKAACAPG
jgi:hypothetical protein